MCIYNTYHKKVEKGGGEEVQKLVETPYDHKTIVTVKLVVVVPEEDYPVQ